MNKDNNTKINAKDIIFEDGNNLEDVIQALIIWMEKMSSDIKKLVFR